MSDPRKLIKVTWIPRHRADDPKDPRYLQYDADRCFDFEMPEDALMSISQETRFRLDAGFELTTNFRYYCSSCGGHIEHTGGSIGSAHLHCRCSLWIGKCSPFSGTWYGGMLERHPLSPAELAERKQRRIAAIEAEYEAVKPPSG
jgi:hypothetical protein